VVIEKISKIPLIGIIITRLSENTSDLEKSLTRYWYGDKFDFYYDMSRQQLEKIKRIVKNEQN